MKKLKKTTVLLFSIFLLGTIVSCSTPQKQAYKSADGFLNAYFAGDFVKAKSYATKASASRVDELAQTRPSGITYEITDKAKILSDTSATIFYKTSDSDIEKTLNLRKEDGKWKVYLGKYDSVDIRELLEKRLEQQQTFN